MYKDDIKRTLLISICLTSLFGWIASSMLLPIFPALFLNNTSGLILGNGTNSEFMYSLSMACFPLAILTGTPIFGAISDIYYQHKTRLVFCGMVFIMLGDGIALAAISLHNVWLFLFSRLICGFCVAVFS